jgi:hypothetical protein
VVALLHAFFSNLPQEWLEGANVIIKQLRPVTSVAMLRIAFRIMGPVLPKLANAHALFNKVQKIMNSSFNTTLCVCVCVCHLFMHLSSRFKTLMLRTKLYEESESSMHARVVYD